MFQGRLQRFLKELSKIIFRRLDPLSLAQTALIGVHSQSQEDCNIQEGQFDQVSCHEAQVGSCSGASDLCKGLRNKALRSL